MRVFHGALPVHTSECHRWRVRQDESTTTKTSDPGGPLALKGAAVHDLQTFPVTNYFLISFPAGYDDCINAEFIPRMSMNVVLYVL